MSICELVGSRSGLKLIISRPVQLPERRAPKVQSAIGSEMGYATGTGSRAWSIAPDLQKEKNEVDDALYRMANRNNLIHRMETLHLAGKSPSMNTVFNQEDRQRVFNHWDRADPPLPRAETGPWGPHDIEDVKNACLGDVFNLKITRPQGPSVADILGNIRAPDYLHRVEGHYFRTAYEPHAPPGLPPKVQSPKPLDDKVFQDLADRLSYLSQERKHKPFANTPETEYARAHTTYQSPESFLSYGEISDDNNSDFSPLYNRSIFCRQYANIVKNSPPPRMKPISVERQAPHAGLRMQMGMPGLQPMGRFSMPTAPAQRDYALNAPVSVDDVFGGGPVIRVAERSIFSRWGGV